MTRLLEVRNRSNYPNEVYEIRTRDSVKRILHPGIETVVPVFENDTCVINAAIDPGVEESDFHAIEECEYKPFSTLPGVNVVEEPQHINAG